MPIVYVQQFVWGATLLFESDPQNCDTYGITVRNVITNARFAVFVSCTLQDAYINNIQLHGNGGFGYFSIKV